MSIAKMRAAATRWDLLKHSFYRRWTSGELTMSELQDYACQYSFVVAAMPRWLDGAARGDAANRETLALHAREEGSHVAMWTDFATAVGVTADELARTEPNVATQRLMDLGDDLVARGLGAGAVWALEAQTPAVSVQKLAGLGQYGVQPGAGTRYFEVHRAMDLRHSEELEAVVAGSGAPESQAGAAEAMSAALWAILTSVEAEVARA
jgi:pyrroloquinoline-quinone synthase